MQAGCIERILTAMGAHVDDTDLQEKASLALRNLSVNAANKVAIAAADGIQRIVDAMRAHSSHTDLQEELCLALYVLSDNDDTVSTSLAKVDGVEVFADMIATSESCDNLNYTISTQGDLILWHHRLSAESRFEGPFYRCPAPISAIRSSGDMVVAGCESGQVVILQTSLPNSLSVSDRTSDRVMG